MSAATTRLSLTKPGGGSTGLIMPPDPVDIDVLNANFDKIDAAIGTNWYSSTTRPAAAFDGQAIMESDTGLLAVWRQALGQWVYPNTTPVVADLNSLPLASQFEGRHIHVDEMNVDFQARDGVWVQQGAASFATTADRNTAYAKAAGAYRIVGALAKVGGVTYEPNGGTAGTDADWNTLASLVLTKADVATFGTGWTPTNTGNHKPRLQRVGDRVFLVGAVTAGGGASLANILTIPVGFRPTQDSFAGAVVGSTTAGYGEAYVEAAGKLNIPNYGNFSPASGNVMPLGGLNWGID